mgnify:CR=1 FL=1
MYAWDATQHGQSVRHSSTLTVSQILYGSWCCNCSCYRHPWHLAGMHTGDCFPRTAGSLIPTRGGILPRRQHSSAGCPAVLGCSWFQRGITHAADRVARHSKCPACKQGTQRAQRHVAHLAAPSTVPQTTCVTLGPHLLATPAPEAAAICARSFLPFGLSPEPSKSQPEHLGPLQGASASALPAALTAAGIAERRPDRGAALCGALGTS